MELVSIVSIDTYPKVPKTVTLTRAYAMHDTANCNGDISHRFVVNNEDKGTALYIRPEER